MDSDTSDTNLVIISRRHRFQLFCRTYWRTLYILIVPIILLPVACVSNKNAYVCFYVFLVMIAFWTADVLHAGVVALMPIGLSSIFDGIGKSFISEMYIRNEFLDCLGIMMVMIAIEHSNIHRRVALKILLVFGCSHYRLSFILFFACMFLAMWMSSIMACGLMMPLVKAILIELEKMGILEIYQTIGKAKQKSNRHEQNVSRPTDFTIFYFLGIAYSSSIGGMSTIIGCQTNQIFKIYYELIFPSGPKIEFPHFMLLNLPGVLLMETLLYLWMNFYFLGMFRSQSDIALEIGMTEEEAQYINTLLATQYQQLRRFKFHEIMVGTVVILTALLQAVVSKAHIDHQGYQFHNHFRTSSPCILCAVILFVLPVNLDCVKFFKTRTDNNNEPLPTSQGKACLNWNLVQTEMLWSVLFISAGSSTLFEALRDSGMTDEFEKFLLLFKDWPPSVLVMVIVIFCKLFTEFAPNVCVVYTLLPGVAKLSLMCRLNPHYLMMAATLASSLPFHLVTGTPVNAMVCAYVHIPPWRMMYAGIGPTVIAVLVVWFTAAVWSAAVWTDISLGPEWANMNIFRQFANKH